MAIGYDPLEWYDQHVQSLLNPGAQPAERVRPPGGLFPPLPPEESESLLSKVGHGVLGGLGYVGGLLDKYTGGRAIRGLLGGKPRELLSILPGSDMWGGTDPEQAVSGSELLGQKPETFLEHLPGMGVEILTNPFTWFSGPGGAITKGLGETAKEIGVMPKTVRAAQAGLEATSPEASKLALAMRPAAARISRAKVEAAMAARPAAAGIGPVSMSELADLGLPMGGIGPVSPGEIAAVANKPLAGLSNFGIPFLAPNLGTLGTGDIGKGIANFTGKYVGDKLRWSGPGKALAGMFKGDAQGATTAAGQKGAIAASEAAPALKYAKGKEVYDLAGELGASPDAWAQADKGEYLANLIEGNKPLPPGHTGAGMPGQMTPRGFQPDAPIPGSPLEKAAEGAKDILKAQPGEVQRLGKQQAVIEDYLTHVATPPEPGAEVFTGGKGKSLFGTKTASDIGRLEEYGDLNKAWKNALHKDQEIRDALTNKEAAALIEKKYLEPWYDIQGRPFDRATLQNAINNPDPALRTAATQAYHDWTAGRQAAAAAQTPADVRAADAALPALEKAHADAVAKMNEPVEAIKASAAQAEEQAKGLASLIRASNPKYAEEGKDIFGNHPWTDMLTRGERQAKSLTNLETAHNMISGSAVVGGAAGPNMVPLKEVLKGAKTVFSDTPNAAKEVARRLTQKGLLSQDEMNLLEPLNNVLGKLAKGTGQDVKDAVDTLKSVQIPKEVATDLSRVVQGFTSPEATRGLIGALDSATALGKTYMAVTWPARYTRNLLQQMWGMFVGGHTEPGAALGSPMALSKPMKDAYTLFHQGGVIPDANKIAEYAGKTAEEASRGLHAEALAGNLYGGFKRGLDVETPAAMPKALQVPGTAAPSMFQMRPESTWNPLDVAGVGGRTETKARYVQVGQNADELIDKMTRGGSYIALRRQGFSPEAALAEVKKVHYDYSNLSDFERKVMRRVLPFYSWTRQNLPAQLQQVLAEPGGKVAGAIRVANDLKGTGFMPDEIAQQMALPLGKQDEKGTQRFMTGLGLPFEDAFNYLQGGRTPTQNIARSAQEMMSQMNPLLKAPLELATGVQLRSGRQLADLYEPTGFLPKNVLADELLMNSPLSRFATTARRMFMDPRKSWTDAALTLGSPVKMTDVDVPTRQAVMEREWLTDMLRGQPGVRSFERPVVQPTQENLQKVSPQTVQYMRALAALEKQGREEAKLRQIGVAK